MTKARHRGSLAHIVPRDLKRIARRTRVGWAAALDSDGRRGTEEEAGIADEDLEAVAVRAGEAAKEA